MRWVAKSNEDEWRARVFSFLFFFRRMHFFFCFPSVTCWCEKHNFSIFHPLHILATYSKKYYGKFFAFLYTQLTRQSSSADTKLFSSPASPATTHSSTFRQTKNVCAKAKDFFTFILVCSLQERIPSSKSL